MVHIGPNVIHTSEYFDTERLESLHLFQTINFTYQASKSKSPPQQENYFRPW